MASTDNGAAERRKLRESAGEFEALLLGQLLRQARQAGDSEDNANNPMREFAEEHLARVLAQGGVLGLAALAESALAGQPRKARGE